MLKQGIYEHIINKETERNIEYAEQLGLVCQYQPIDAAESPQMLANYLANAIRKKLEDTEEQQDRVNIINRITKLNESTDVDKEWSVYVNNQKIEEFNTLIKEERLKSEKAVKFIEESFSRGYVTEGGTEVYDILPPVNPFDRNANRQGVFQKVLDRLTAFFNKYLEIANGNFSEDNGE